MVKKISNLKEYLKLGSVSVIPGNVVNFLQIRYMVKKFKHKVYAS